MNDLTRPAVTPRAYRCQCGYRIFFRNSECLGCDRALGFLASEQRMQTLEPGSAEGLWRVVGGGVDPAAVPAAISAPDPDTSTTVPATEYRRCRNFDSPAGCNWLVPADAAGDLCQACALNRMIPNLAEADNAVLWARMEGAKRRLVSQLLGLGLPVRSKVADDPEHGLAYDFLRSEPDGPRVLTGHDDGIITINIEEADDAAREKMRQAMNEPYRTLLGHFRHEVGHYYWDQLIDGTPWLPHFRALFGDDRADYGEALERNYKEGPPADWQERFITAYASMHPWEDWAETWAHYLHLRDTIDTAASFGMLGGSPRLRRGPFSQSDLWQGQAQVDQGFLQLLHEWIEVTSVMNEMSSAMGQQDFYPFALNREVVPKLHFIHCVVTAAAAGKGVPWSA